jgi:tartrate-resistant acid phosphatase type 5
MLQVELKLYLRILLSFFLIGLALPISGGTDTAPQSSTNSVLFAVIGDFGLAGQREAEVANLVKSWKPDFITTVGDNNYLFGASSTIDQNIGQYYHDYIFPYSGGYGAGATTNRFFPVLGNHDWYTANAQPYHDYFTLPNNERYYEFAQGPVHFFMLNSDSDEPDGITIMSSQATWLQKRLAVSTARWKLVFLHHAPYSSGSHGSQTTLQWPYQSWGATAVLAGHDHTYERIIRDGFPYFVNGIGGASLYGFGTPVSGSQVRYNEDYGAMRITASDTRITFELINCAGMIIDSYTINATSAYLPIPID